MAKPPAELIIRPLKPEDSAELAALESRCAGAAQWGESALREVGTIGIGGLAASRNGTVLGFVLARAVADEMEILNLAVDPDSRRQRIGRRLIEQAIEDNQRIGVWRVYLEVRESNSGARAFYASMGFSDDGRRKNYYSRPVEDALVLVFRPR